MAKAKEKAPEKNAEEKDKVKRPRIPPINPKAKIYLVTDDEKVRPRRPGTAVAKIFSFYKNGMTVAKFLESAKDAGGRQSHIRRDLKHGRIRLEGEDAA